MSSLRSLPFRALVPTTYGSAAGDVVGVYAGRGLLRMDGDALVLEIRPLGTTGEAEVETFRIPLADVSEVEFVRGWTRQRLVLRPTRLAAFSGLPGVRNDRLELTVARRDRDRASQWAAALVLALLERGDS